MDINNLRESFKKLPMRVYGVGVTENDIALDFAMDVIKDIFKVAESNEQYLLLADMSIKYKYILDEDEYIKILKVITEEILNICNWEEIFREDRLNVLLELREEIKNKGFLKKEED